MPIKPVAPVTSIFFMNTLNLESFSREIFTTKCTNKNSANSIWELRPRRVLRGKIVTFFSDWGFPDDHIFKSTAPESHRNLSLFIDMPPLSQPA